MRNFRSNISFFSGEGHPPNKMTTGQAAVSAILLTINFVYSCTRRCMVSRQITCLNFVFRHPVSTTDHIWDPQTKVILLCRESDLQDMVRGICLLFSWPAPQSRCSQTEGGGRKYIDNLTKTTNMPNYSRIKQRQRMRRYTMNIHKNLG